MFWEQGTKMAGGGAITVGKMFMAGGIIKTKK